MPSFSNYTWIDWLVGMLDIVVVWYILYRLLMIIRGTKAIQLLKGILIILVIKGVSVYVGLHTLDAIVTEVMTWGFLAVIIIFQPELRRALEQLGRAKFFKRSQSNVQSETVKSIKAVVKATGYLAKRRIGALMTIEKETGLNEYIDTGIEINAEISSELLINIFIPNTPLHDGAVIMAQNKIAAATCVLPLSDNEDISRELGTRHRAAVGISEATDCFTIVVSEESGHISVTKDGVLYRDVSIERLEEMLYQEMVTRTKAANGGIWKWGVKKNG